MGPGDRCDFAVKIRIVRAFCPSGSDEGMSLVFTNPLNESRERRKTVPILVHLRLVIVPRYTTPWLCVYDSANFVCSFSLSLRQ